MKALGLCRLPDHWENTPDLRPLDLPRSPSCAQGIRQTQSRRRTLVTGKQNAQVDGALLTQQRAGREWGDLGRELSEDSRREKSCVNALV